MIAIIALWQKPLAADLECQNGTVYAVEVNECQTTAKHIFVGFSAPNSQLMRPVALFYGISHMPYFAPAISRANRLEIHTFSCCRYIWQRRRAFLCLSIYMLLYHCNFIWREWSAIKTAKIAVCCRVVVSRQLKRQRVMIFMKKKCQTQTMIYALNDFVWAVMNLRGDPILPAIHIIICVIEMRHCTASIVSTILSAYFPIHHSDVPIVQGCTHNLHHLHEEAWTVCGHFRHRTNSERERANNW